MTAAAADLQGAVFAALAGDGGLAAAIGGRVFDHAPASAAFPYITFGRTSVYNWSTATERGSEQIFTLHVWSKGRGKKEALAVMEIARACLDDASLSLGDHHLVAIRHEFAEVRYDEDADVHHGLLRFRALIENP